MTVERRSFVQLLVSHCHLISDWDSGSSMGRVVCINSPSLPPLSIPTAAAPHTPLPTDKRKDSIKEFHVAVARARQTHAVLAIQSLWRGHFTRKRLHHLLSHAKYYDADLENLMDAHDLTDYLGILNEASLPELSDDWLTNGMTSGPGGGGGGGGAMVYGDHRRKKLTSPRTATAERSIPHHVPITPERRAHGAISPRGQFDAARIKSTRPNGDWVVEGKPKVEILRESGVYIHQQQRAKPSQNSDPKIHETFQGEEEWEVVVEEHLQATRGSSSSVSRPYSSSSSFSRPASSSSTISGAPSSSSTQRFGRGEYTGDNDDIDLLLHTGRTRLSASSRENHSVTGDAADWGVSNPTAVHSILKRTNKSQRSSPDFVYRSHPLLSPPPPP